jgi:calcineurin-like phosphoesterase family protein
MKTYFIADLHLGHKNIVTFTDNNGERIRPFDGPGEMEAHMEDVWNATVRPVDHVYILGDVVIPRKAMARLDRYNGRKRIVLGNHDPYRTEEYLKVCDRVYGVRVMNGAVATHVPVHPNCLNRRTWQFNIHGHLHQNLVMGPDGEPDPRYFNVSCEQLNYKPIERDEICAILHQRGLPEEFDLKFL